MRRQQASCPDGIGMGVSSRPHRGKSPAAPPCSAPACATAASMSDCTFDRGCVTDSVAVSYGVFLSDSLSAGLGSPGIEEYHGRHAGQESACGLCSPGRQQRGDNSPLIHAAERLRSTGSLPHPTCMHKLHHSLNVLHLRHCTDCDVHSPFQ